MIRQWGRATIVLSALMLIMGCGVAQPPAVDAQPRSFRILCSDDLRDITASGLLADLNRETGIRAELTFAPTATISAHIAAGSVDPQVDATWLTTNSLVTAIPGGRERLSASRAVMSSPLAVGVRAEPARALGWGQGRAPTWEVIRQSAESGKLPYAVGNPLATMTGHFFINSATAAFAAGKLPEADALSAQEPQLRGLLAGHRNTGADAQEVADRFNSDAYVSAHFAFESTLITINKSGVLPTPLTIMVPADGSVVADFPLNFLAQTDTSRRGVYDKITAWLLSPAGQKSIMERTSRRPVDPNIRLDVRFGSNKVIPLPLSSDRARIDSLRSIYQDRARRPQLTVFAVDVSGSTAGARLTAVKQSLTQLATTPRVASSFNPRETVVVIPYATNVGDPIEVTISDKESEKALAGWTEKVNALQAQDWTATHTALLKAYAVIGEKIKASPGLAASIVLLTEGESNRGPNLAEFGEAYKNVPIPSRAPVLAIGYGEANLTQLHQIVDITSGHVFDGTPDLAEALRQARSYQ